MTAALHPNTHCHCQFPSTSALVKASSERWSHMPDPYGGTLRARPQIRRTALVAPCRPRNLLVPMRGPRLGLALGSVWPSSLGLASRAKAPTS